MKKKMVALVACFCVLIRTASAVQWPGWAHQAENWAKQNGLDTFFLTHPTQAVTRGQVALILYQAAGCPVVSDEIPFTDIPEQYEDAVTWAAAQGLVQGGAETSGMRQTNGSHGRNLQQFCIAVQDCPHPMNIL